MVNNLVIRDAVVDGLKDDSRFADSQLAAELNRTLGFAVNHGIVGPDLDSDQRVYCKLLAAGGLLEERGDKNRPIHYLITNKGRNVYERVWV